MQYEVGSPSMKAVSPSRSLLTKTCFWSIEIEGFRADWSQLEENEGFSNRPSAQNIWSWAKPWLWVVALIMYYRLDNRNRDSEEIIFTFRYRYETF